MMTGNLVEVRIFYNKLFSDCSPMQARWQFSDHLLGKQVTVEVDSKVCMYILQCTYAINPLTRFLSPNLSRHVASATKKLFAVAYSSEGEPHMAF